MLARLRAEAVLLRRPAGPGGVNGLQEFTPGPDAFPFVVPAGVTRLIVELYGGGGGGGGTDLTGVCPGGGGGAGAYVRTVLNVNPGDTLSVRVGFGGPGGMPSFPGSDGGDTKILDATNTVLAGAGGGGHGVNGSNTSPFFAQGGQW